MNLNFVLKSTRFLFFPLILFLLYACAATPEETLKRIAEETQKTCPLIIDEYTVMKKAEVLPDRTLKFTYDVKGTFNESMKKEMSNAMKPVLIEKLKQRSELEFYLVNNVRFEHLFLDTQSNTVMHIKIEPFDYK